MIEVVFAVLLALAVPVVAAVVHVDGAAAAAAV